MIESIPTKIEFIPAKPAPWSGFYSLPDAARIAGVNPRSLKRWATGYPYQYHGQTFTSASLLQSSVAGAEGQEFLTFQQLIEVMFIRLFRAYGVSVPVIRAVARTVAARYDTEHPFAIPDLQTDGKTIFADSVAESVRLESTEKLSPARITEDLHRGQIVIRDFAQEFFKEIEYGRLEAERYWPLGKTERVIIDPQRSFGSPIDYATGVPTSALFGMYKAGESPEEIARWYDVEKASVIAAVRYETSLRHPALRPAA